MSNLFTLFGTIAVNADSANRTIDSTTRKAEQSGSKIGNAFSKIGSAAVACGKVIASGLAVGAAAMGALMKGSLESFADYEQLVGGIETLFKESKQKVMDYANEAYKTAGLSANEYMETVTSFSASLLQGLGGDTERASEYAHMAIVDMSDNANKMGSDMATIQNAYQGFAKQNYTMLDNLKLGYGGTQEEMARLINDSGVLGRAIKVDAKTLKQVPFHKIIEAINVIQERMGIAGTTAAEATETISGSFSALQSTWTNLMTGLASGDQDIDLLVDNFLKAFDTLGRNIDKVLPRLVQNIGKAASRLMQSAGKKLNEVWTGKIWPYLQETLRTEIGIDLPDWSEIVGKATAWWENVKKSCGFLARLLGFDDWTDEDKKAVEQWWKDQGVIFSWMLGRPTAEEDAKIIEDFRDWWEDNIQKAAEAIATIHINVLEPIADWWASTLDKLFPWFNASETLEAAKNGEFYNEVTWDEFNSGVRNNELAMSSLGAFLGADLSPAVRFGSVDGFMSDELGSLSPVGTSDRLATALDKLEAIANNSNGTDIAAAVRDAVAGIQFSVMLDTGVLVGQLAPHINTSLGSLAGRRERVK